MGAVWSGLRAKVIEKGHSMSLYIRVYEHDKRDNISIGWYMKVLPFLSRMVYQRLRCTLAVGASLSNKQNIFQERNPGIARAVPPLAKEGGDSLLEISLL